MEDQQPHRSLLSEYIELGQKLKSAREKLRWDVEEVADKLYINATTVQMIESGSYDKSKLNTFMRGYIRNYAKLVKIPEAETRDLFKTLGVVAEIPKQITPVKLEQSRPSLKDKPMKIVTYVIVAILIIFVLSWWHSHRAINGV